MVYIDYERYKIRLMESQERFNEMLTEKERLFTQVMPNAIRYDKDQIQSCPDGSMLEDYVISLEDKHIDDKLRSLRQIMDDRMSLLEVKEKELRASAEIPDRIYVRVYLDGFKVKRVAREINYSKSQVYRIIDKIEKTCDKMRK